LLLCHRAPPGAYRDKDSINTTRCGLQDAYLLLYGDIAKEQLMPKNFVFYNPEEHQNIIALLEQKRPAAIISATGRNTALAGGVYPFPMIEDGDFDIPSVYMTEEEGKKLLSCIGKSAILESRSTRIPAKAYNVIARKGKEMAKRIVITAHIDAKKCTPGAIDNATGVVILLLLAEQLKDYDGDRLLEIVAFNGEDYFAAPGQMDYIRKNQEHFKNIVLNINIDGAGYKEGKSTFSLFGLPEKMKGKVSGILAKYDGITEGIQWPQGDHSIFVQQGCPAIAVSSKWFIDRPFPKSQIFQQKLAC
jgi:aminopeptidase YwaD